MSPEFKIVFFSVLSIFGVLLILAFVSVIVFQNPMTEAQRGIFQLMTHGITTCIGFVIGGVGTQRSRIRTR